MASPNNRIKEFGIVTVETASSDTDARDIQIVGVTGGSDTGTVVGQGSAITITAGDSPNAVTGSVNGTAGGSITITSGAGGDAAGTGEDTGGAGGNINFVTSTGGINTDDGFGNADDGDGGRGGDFVFTGAVGGTTTTDDGKGQGGTGGSMIITLGDGGDAAVGGAMHGGDGGSYTLTAGSGGLGVGGGSTDGGVAGSISITAGQGGPIESGGTGNAIVGGAASVTGGIGSDGAVASVGGGIDGRDGGQGGSGTIEGGDGGGGGAGDTGRAPGDGGNGGTVNLLGGAAGDVGAQNGGTGAADGGNGGSVNVRAGAGSANGVSGTDGNGGNVSVHAGAAGGGTGTDGVINIGTVDAGNLATSQINSGNGAGVPWVHTGTFSASGGITGGTLQDAYNGSGTVALDVDGGNNLSFDSAVADPTGVGLFLLTRSPFTLLKAPDAVPASANDGIDINVSSGAGSSRTALSGAAGTDAGAATYGGLVPGGDGGSASGGGAPGGLGGTGAVVQLTGSAGGDGGNATSGDAGGAGGLGGSANAQAGDGGSGGDGTATAAAGAGGTGGTAVVQGGDGRSAGTDSGGGGAAGGAGGLLTLKGGDGGAASGASTGGNAGGVSIQGGIANAGGGGPGTEGVINIATVSGSAINSGSTTAWAHSGTMTATSFNGVALTTGGSATNYLDETGSYSVPSGGGGSGPAPMDTTNSPIAVWNFDGVLTDDSGNGHTLVLNTGTANYGAGHVLGAESLQVDALTTYDVTDAAFQLTGAVTVMAVVTLDNLTGRKFIVSFGAEAPDTPESRNHLYSLLVNNDDMESFHESGTGGGAGVNEIFISSKCLRQHETLHLALTRASDGVTVTLYVNGTEVDSTVHTNAPTGGSAGRITVGAFQDNSTSVFSGMLHGLKIVGSELNASQILAEAQTSLGS